MTLHDTSKTHDDPTVEAVPPADEPGSARSPRLNLVALGLFLFVPFVAALLGVSGGATDNEQREAAAFPDLVEAPLDEARWAEAGRWFEDRLPARGRAIEVEADIAQAVDDRPLAPTGDLDQVSLGTDGWLFFNESVRQLCITAEQKAEWLAEIDRTSALVERTGRRLIVTIAPDRAIVAPDRLGRIDATCVVFNYEVIEEFAARDDVVALGDVVDFEAAALKLDTHWSSAGAIAAAELIVDTIKPGLWDDPELTRTPMERPGDLQRMVQDEGFEITDHVTFARQAASKVTTFETATKDYPMLEAVTPGGDELDVVLIHDSYGGHSVGSAAEYVRPWFENFANVRLLGNTAMAVGEEPVARRVVDADVVVALFVQRSIVGRFGTGQSVGPFVSALLDELNPTTLGTTPVDGGQSTEPAPAFGAIVIDGPTAGTSEAFTLTASTGAVLGRVNLTERIVVTVPQGTSLIIGPEATSVRFVALD